MSFSSPLIAGISPQEIWDFLKSISWTDLLKSIGGQIVGLTVGFVVSWFVLMRKRRLALNRLMKGDSDDVLFQSHHLVAVPGTDKVVLLFRSVAPANKVDRLYDNPAANDIVRQLVEKTSLNNPVLQTEGTLGFEVLNDAFTHLAGHLANNPYDREEWLFTMTCEDRQVVRRKCIRCFLIKARDLERFTDWDWCRGRVLCEWPWHWYRIVALHQIAIQWKSEAARDRSGAGSPLVDNQATHSRIREMSAGVFSKEISINPPTAVPWGEKESELKRLGLQLSVAALPASAQSPAPQPATET